MNFTRHFSLRRLACAFALPLRRVLSALGIWLLALAAFPCAQGFEDAVPFYRQSQSAELRSPLDSVNLATFPEARGIRLGQFSLNPYATEDSTYLDNPLRSEHNRLDDVLQEYTVGFNSAFRPREFVRFTLNYEFGWHDYVRDTARDYLSHIAGFTATLDRVGVEGLSLNFFEQYLQTGNSNALENEIVQFSRYQTDRAGMRAQYSYNRLKVAGEYSYTLQDYFERVNQISNFRTHTGNLELAWEWLPKRLELFETVQVQRTLFDHNGIADFDAITVLSGVRGVYSKLQYSLGVGYVTAVPVYRNGVQGDSSVNATLTYTPTRRLQFDILASRGFVPDVRTGATLETDLTADMKMVLTSRGKLTLTYARNQADRLIGVQQISVAYSNRFDYKITRNASAIFQFTRYERTSTLIGDSFTDNEVRLGIKLAW